jgi:hypothetical protein
MSENLAVTIIAAINTVVAIVVLLVIVRWRRDD